MGLGIVWPRNERFLMTFQIKRMRLKRGQESKSSDVIDFLKEGKEKLAGLRVIVLFLGRKRLSGRVLSTELEAEGRT